MRLGTGLQIKPTIDKVHVCIKKERESSRVEIVPCAMSLIIVRNSRLLQDFRAYQGQLENGLAKVLAERPSLGGPDTAKSHVELQ